MNKIIAFAGQFAVAKDTAADYLVKKLGGNWKRTAFASAVKKIYMESFEVDMDFIEKWKRIDEPPPGFDMNVRKSLQFIGDGFRKIQGDIWIKLALRNKDDIIFADQRYLNEAKAVKAKGGINILVWRKGYENDDPNPSESQIKPFVNWCLSNRVDGPIINSNWQDMQYFDYFLRNDGTLDDLYYKIDNHLIPYLQEKL